jgi:mannose-6-phosphate isomerase-like protein (cupin superfamily)
MSEGFEKVSYNGKLLAVIIYDSYNTPGVNFFTPSELSQQVAHMTHRKGKVIDAHVHNPVPREVFYTQEALFIKSGRLRVDFYDDNRVYLESRLLGAGDVILLVSGGHGFEVIEDLRMIEVKQGPYTDDRDKTRFDPVAQESITIKNPI